MELFERRSLFTFPLTYMVGVVIDQNDKGFAKLQSDDVWLLFCMCYP